MKIKKIEEILLDKYNRCLFTVKQVTFGSLFFYIMCNDFLNILMPKSRSPVNFRMDRADFVVILPFCKRKHVISDIEIILETLAKMIYICDNKYMYIIYR